MSTKPGVEKVLVTGASGYIATHIVQQLQQAGYKVRGTVRSLSNPKKVDPLRKLCPDAAHELELVEADLTNEECWKDAVQGCSHVIHTASPFPDKSPKDENVVIKPAVEGTTRVLQACKDAGGVKRVVLTSSVAAITDLTVTNKEPITEETWRNLDSKMEDAYGKSKALAEKAAWDFIEKLPAESKFELAAINPSLVLGPVLCGVPGTSIEVIRRLLERDPPAMPRINFPLCDVRDVAKAHIIAMTHPEAAGHRHLIAPYNMWFHEMADVLREEFKDKGYKPPSMIAPPILLKMVSWFDSTVKYILPLQGQVSTLSKYRFLEVLDIKPYDPKESLIDMAYSCIDRGFIVKKKQYVNPKAQQTTEGASASS